MKTIDALNNYSKRCGFDDWDDFRFNCDEAEVKAVMFLVEDLTKIEEELGV